MIKSILWDFDGVILESVNVKTEAFYDMYLPYGKEVAQKVVEHHIAHGGVSRFEKFKIYHSEFLDKEITDTEVQKLAQQFSDLVLDKVLAAPFVKGSEEFIKSFYNKFNFFIITGTPDDEIKMIVNKRNLSSYFKGIMGSPVKKPVWTKKLIDDQLILPSETVFIGDATSDYEAATQNDVHFVLRETEDNTELFKGYQVPKIKDLTVFERVIEEL